MKESIFYNEIRISDLQNKDIINIKTGEKIGNITDILIDLKTGSIKKIYIFERKKPFSILNKQDEHYINFNDIAKIGADVILVDKKN